MWKPSRIGRAQRRNRRILRGVTALAESLEARYLLSDVQNVAWAQADTVPFEPAVLPYSIFGSDDRTRITDTTQFPYSAIGRISVKFPNGVTQFGSGAMVSPFHILTAGHVVHDSGHGGWATEIKVAVARDGSTRPNGPEANFTHYRSSPEWISSGDRNHDWALITLDRSIGDFSGYFGVESQATSAYTGMAVETAGYPVDKGGTQMYAASGVINSATEFELRYNGTMDTYGGQSGSPIWRSVNGGPIINGIHAYGYSAAGYNSATRITTDKFNSLQAWIAEDMVSRVPADKPDLLDYDGWFASSHSSFSPATVLRGGTVQISARIANLGTADAGPYTLSLYASTDATITAADHALGSAILTTGAMGSMQFNWSGPLPGAMPAGQYYIGWIIDSGNAVGEFKEDNNTGVIVGSRLSVNAAAPDRFEPNDSFAAATDLGSFTTRSEPGLTIHTAGNADYFRFIPAASGQLTASITFQNAQGDLDLDFYNSSFGNLASSRTAANIESVSLNVVGGQTYYVKISGTNGTTSPGYDLAFSMGFGPDVREINDSFAQAADLGTITVASLAGLNIHEAGNEDYFTFIAGTTGSLTATLNFTHVLGDIDLRLYGPLQDYLDGSTGITGEEIVTGDVVAGQRYYLRVSPVGVEVNPDYGLTVSVIESIPPDRFEPNDSFTEAADFGSISSVNEAGLTIHESFNPDYYSFTPVAGGQLRIDVSFTHAFGDVDIYLFDATHVEVASSLSENSVEQIVYEVIAGETYYLLVEACNSATSPDYSISISILTGTAEIRGVKFLDRNASGMQDADEPPLQGWTIFLDENRNGTLDEGERSTVTSATGEYAFTHLIEGTYYVGEVVPPGWIQVFPGSGNLTFDIDLRFMDDSLTSSQRDIFQTAAARWSQIITGDIAQILTTQGLVDDILIDITALFIDGLGHVLGRAGPDELRDGVGLPAYGKMEFDLDDLDSLESSGRLLDVVIHEMAHVLGFGTIWDIMGLITDAGTSDPRYTGSAALAEYNAIFNLAETSIPLENTGGEGTADAHWRETIFGDELMTGFLDATNPLSRLTIASMADLGYIVDLDMADLYSPAEAGSAYNVPNTHVITLTESQVRTGVDFSSFPTQLTGSPDADAYYLRLGEDGLTVELWESAAPEGAPLYSIDMRLLPSLSFVALDGDDQLTIDFSRGNPVPAGGLRFDPGPDSPGDRLIILGSTAADIIDITDAEVTVNGSSIYLDAPVHIELDALGGLDSITVGGSASITFIASQDLATLILQGNATASLQPSTQQVLLARDLILAAGATLDLADNDLVVRIDESARQAMFDMLRNAIQTGRNLFAPDLWTGPGVISSAARTDPSTGLALALNTAGAGMILSSLNGLILQPADILVRHTYNGDANLDGQVGPGDYFRIDLAFLTLAGGQPAVDLNYDGLLNGDDYFLIDQAFMDQTIVLAAAVPSIPTVPAPESALPPAVLPFSQVPVIAFAPSFLDAAGFKTLESMEPFRSSTYTLLHERDVDGVDLRSDPPADF